jgi:hypothetical protein
VRVVSEGKVGLAIFVLCQAGHEEGATRCGDHKVK